MPKTKEIFETNGLRVRRAYIEEIDKKPKIGNKYKAKYNIENKVYEDLADSVADNAKLISLVFAMGAVMYKALPDDLKNNIPQDAREKIEYAIEKYHSIETWGDIQLATEGNEAIDKLLDRQGKIGEIIKEVYGVGK